MSRALTDRQLTVTDRIEAVVWTTDRDLRLLSVGGGAAERFDWTDWIGVTLDERFVEASAEVRAHRSALAGRSADYLHETAGSRWRVCVDPFRDDTGAIVGTAAVAVDLGERETYELPSALMYALVDTLPLAVYTATIDEDPHPRYIAPQVEELLGIPAADFRFDTLRAGIHPDDQDAAIAALDLADARGDDLSIEYRFVRPDGSIVWIEDASRVVTVAGETFAQGYLLDITTRKRDEAVLARTADVRHRLAVIGRRALEGADRNEVIDAIFALLSDDFDVECATILEPHDGQLVATRCFGWEAVGAVAQPGVPAHIAFTTLQPFVGSTPVVVDSQLVHAGIRQSVAVPVVAGDECLAVVSVHSRGSAAFDEGDVALVEQVANLVGAVCARERMDERLRASQRLEAIGQLAAGVAHDFNNMLTVIAGRTAFAMANVDSEGASHLACVLDAAERSRSLTKQLLAFSRKQVLRQEPVALSTLVASLTPMLNALLDENLTLSYDGEDETVLADPAQIENVIVNLAANARDAMPAGGTLTIRTGVADIGARTAGIRDVPPGRYGTIAVIDEGHGMPADVQARIFEPFFTTKGPGVGTGLGLAGAYGTVRQSGGFISVQSEVGAGSTFVVHLPVTEAVESDLAAAPDDLVAGTPASVLLVEDEAVVRDLLAEQLTAMGHRVTCAATGAEALGLVAESAFDVVLTDVGLPGMDGATLAATLASSHAPAPVILMSGYPDDYVESRHTTLPLLQKPFGAAELQSALARVLA